MFLPSLIILFSIFLAEVSTRCVQMGNCGIEPVSKAAYSCKYDGDPVPLKNQTYLEKLRSICPQFVNTSENGTMSATVCCTPNQIDSLVGDFGLPNQILGRCPSCYRSFVNVFCYMVCDPMQSVFVSVQKYINPAPQVIDPPPNMTNFSAVTSLEYMLTAQFAVGLFNSCRDVMMPSGNQLALSVMCGTSYEKCTPEQWLYYTGSTTNGNTPMQINMCIPERPATAIYNCTNPNLRTKDFLFYPCSYQVPNPDPQIGGMLPACSCQDCRTQCPPLPPPEEPPSPFMILGLDGYAFIMFFTFATCALAILTYELVTHLNFISQGLSSVSSNFSSSSLIESFTSSNSHSQEKQSLPSERQPLMSRAYPNSDAASPSNTRRPDADLEANAKAGGGCLGAIQSGWLAAGVAIEVYLQLVCTRWGTWCAKHALLVVVLSLTTCVILSACIPMVRVTTNPVELWSAPESDVRRQKEYFDNTFGPFYRTQQVIVRHSRPGYFAHQNTGSSEDTTTFTNVFEMPFLDALLTLQESILAIEANVTLTHTDNATESSTRKVRYSDICNKPLAPNYDICAVMSPLGYFHSNRSWLHYDVEDEVGFVLADYIDHLTSCVNNPSAIVDATPLNMPCLAEYGGPVFPFTAFGAFPVSALTSGVLVNNYLNASTLVLTFIVNNSPNPKSEQMQMALAWETEFIKFMKNYSNENMTVSFNSERSIEDEIDRQSKSDVSTIALSYIIMLSYVALTLGNIRSYRTVFVDVKISLGLAGVLIVIFSVSSSIGLMGLVGFPMTLIIIEVIPFLVLAIGVDNIFIIVQSFQRSQPLPGESLENQIGRVFGTVGPSMILSSSAESIAFFMGTMTRMPAVQMFSLYSGVAIIFDALLQFSAFLGLFALDSHRQRKNRMDVFCLPNCCGDANKEDEKIMHPNGLPYSTSNATSTYGSVRSNAVNANPNHRHQEYEQPPNAISNNSANDSDPLSTSNSNSKEDKAEQRRRKDRAAGLLYYFVAHYYSRWLLNKFVRPVVVLCFIAWVCTCISLAPRLSIGLNQMLSMPTDSYVLDYFLAENKDLAVGPPGYLVIEDGHDYTTKVGQQLICGSGGCPPDSLVGQVYTANLRAANTKIASLASSWLDDYFDWLKPSGNPQCCRIHKHTLFQDEFCPSTSTSSDCVNCNIQWNNSRPISQDFLHYLPMYLSDVPGLLCAKGGKAAYSSAVKLYPSNNTVRIGATSFMFYHSVLKTSADFISAYRHALDLASNITRTIRNAIPDSKYKVFPYSIFYVYYEQYLHIIDDSIINLGSCLLVITVASALLLGLRLLSALFVAGTCGSILLSLLGYMTIFQIELNALSLVNLVVGLGISVEFSAHLIRAFGISRKLSRRSRARSALAHMGSSVLSGITLTKILGVCVLAFAHSQLFQVYYFKMYAAIVMFGAFHGLVVLPVILSYCGPSYSEERNQRLIAARHRLHIESRSENESEACSSGAPLAHGEHYQTIN